MASGKEKLEEELSAVRRTGRDASEGAHSITSVAVSKTREAFDLRELLFKILLMFFPDAGRDVFGDTEAGMLVGKMYDLKHQEEELQRLKEENENNRPLAAAVRNMNTKTVLLIQRIAPDAALSTSAERYMALVNAAARQDKELRELKERMPVREANLYGQELCGKLGVETGLCAKAKVMEEIKRLQEVESKRELESAALITLAEELSGVPFSPEHQTGWALNVLRSRTAAKRADANAARELNDIVKERILSLRAEICPELPDSQDLFDSLTDVETRARELNNGSREKVRSLHQMIREEEEKDVIQYAAELDTMGSKGGLTWALCVIKKQINELNKLTSEQEKQLASTDATPWAQEMISTIEELKQKVSAGDVPCCSMRDSLVALRCGVESLIEDRATLKALKDLVLDMRAWFCPELPESDFPLKAMCDISTRGRKMIEDLHKKENDLAGVTKGAEEIIDGLMLEGRDVVMLYREVFPEDKSDQLVNDVMVDKLTMRFRELCGVIHAHESSKDRLKQRIAKLQLLVEQMAAKLVSCELSGRQNKKG